jgi:hypothetical protein
MLIPGQRLAIQMRSRTEPRRPHDRRAASGVTAFTTVNPEHSGSLASMERTSRRSYRNILAATCLVASLTVISAGCTRSPVSLRPAELPPNAASILGEALAFEAHGVEGSRGRATVSLATMPSQLGGFEGARVLAFDRAGNSVGMTEHPVKGDRMVAIDASAGFTYIVYPVIPRLDATYRVLCDLARLRLPATLVSRVCLQVLCSSEAFRASELPDRVPGLKEHLGGIELSADTIGGFDLGGRGARLGLGGGDICDHCVYSGVIYPTSDCLGPIGPFPDPGATACGGGRLVFSRSGDAAEAGHSKIHVMEATGAQESALSPAGVSDSGPDVNIAGSKVLFFRAQGPTTGLHVMSVNGTNVTPVPGAADAIDATWGRGGFDFVILTAPTQGEQTALFRINADGTGRTQITHPPQGAADSQPAVLDAKDVVFVRREASGRTQIFMQPMFEPEQPSVAITSVPDGTGVKLPAAGHVQDARHLAFVLTFGAFASDKIRVTRFQANGIVLDTLHEFELPAPVEHNIMGIDFSVDDSCLFVSAQADDVTTGLDIAARFELFSVAADGSSLTRLTTNQFGEFSPSAITGP